MGFEITMVLGYPVLSHTAYHKDEPHFAALVGGTLKNESYPIHHFITLAAVKLDGVGEGNVNRLYSEHASRYQREWAPPGWFTPGAGGDRPIVRDKYGNFNYWINPEMLLGALIVDWEKLKNPNIFAAGQLLAAFRSLHVAGNFTELQGLLYGH